MKNKYASQYICLLDAIFLHHCYLTRNSDHRINIWCSTWRNYYRCHSPNEQNGEMLVVKDSTLMFLCFTQTRLVCFAAPPIYSMLPHPFPLSLSLDALLTITWVSSTTHNSLFPNTPSTRRDQEDLQQDPLCWKMMRNSQTALRTE